LFEVIAGIRAAAKANSAAPALITGGRAISYGELIDMIARISNYLADRGLKPRAKVFINVADPDLRLIVMLSAIHCGLVPFALLDIGDLGPEVDYDYVIAAPAAQAPDLTADIVLDPSVLMGRLSDRTLREFGEPGDDAILFIGSTTGTTGRRKLIAETWGSWRGKARQRGAVPGERDTAGPEWMRMARGARVLFALGDVTYIGVASAQHLLTVGAAFVRMSRDRAECLASINTIGVTWITITPGILAELMNGMDSAGIACPSVKRILLVGMLFDRALVKRVEEHFPAADVVVSYGTTEIGGIATAKISSRTFEYGFVGELFPGVKLVTAGTRSEPAPLVVALNRATFVPYYSQGRTVPASEAFYTLPDLGFVEHGSVYLAGRDDEVLNFDGNKTAYSAIEEALRADGGIRDVAIASAAPLGDAAGLVIGIVADRDLDLGALARRVAAVVKSPRVADHVRIFRTDAIPRNAFGKMDRAALIALQQSRAGRG
jgi:long-chain acyl-CoA synthetase